MSDNIPLEIQTEIIKFLPVKSLVQFRSVSKQWKSLIDSSEFLSHYHDINSHPPEHLFVSYFDQHSSEQKYVSVVDDDTFPTHKVSPIVPASVIKLGDKLSVIGSSNGLFCLYNVSLNNTAVIWNPTIGKSVDIHIPEVLDWSYETILGFGVCPHTLDPKIVKVRFILNDEAFVNIIHVPWQVEVYTISSGVWRSLLCNSLPRESIQLTGSVVDMDGFIYFMAYEWIDSDEELQRSFLIMSFDMKSEEFTEIRLPNSLAYENNGDLFISRFRESIVVLEFSFNEDMKKSCRVWMMENDVQRSVTKLFTINLPNATLTHVYGFRKSGELLVEGKTGIEEHAKLFVYDQYSKHMTYVGTSRRRFSFFFAGSYVETILLLNH